tara:strand:+ start:233 stop:2839 length:2607 start_codon:yes stop_codon:yes gene_type:complete
MNFVKIICFLLLLIPHLIVNAQDLKRVFRTLEKEDVAKAKELLESQIAKDSINPGSRWMYARLLSCDSLPKYYDLDQARIYGQQAVADFQQADEKMTLAFITASFNLFDIEKTNTDIENQTYEKALYQYTMDAFHSFLSLYPKSIFTKGLLYNIDSLAFDSVTQIHNWRSYENYVKEYSTSRFSDHAKARYERLLYEEKTTNNDLSEFKNFINEYPNSRYVTTAFAVIFERTLDLNTSSCFLNHLQNYPQSPYSKELLSILYHMNPDVFFELSPFFGFEEKIDSLKLISQLNAQPLLPFLEQGKIGFMNLEGIPILKPNYHSLLKQELLCQTLQADIIGVSSTSDIKKLINRAGTSIYSGPMISYEDLGFGFLKIKEPTQIKIIHKSGKLLFDELIDAAIVGGRWLKVRREKGWALATYTGRILTPFTYDEINTVGDFWTFHVDKKMAFHNLSFVQEGIEKGHLTPTFLADDYELINDSLILLYHENKQALLESNMTFLIPWEAGRDIYIGDIYHYTQGVSDYKIYNEQIIQDLGTNVFEDLIDHPPWLGLKKNYWYLIDQKGTFIRVDSIQSFRELALIIRDTDSSYVLFPNKKSLLINKEVSVNSLPYRDHQGKVRARYLLKAYRGVKEIYNKEGKLMFKGNFDQIDLLTDSLFKITLKGKQGVLDPKGNVIIPIDYDFIEQKNHLTQLLKNGKITGFDLDHNIKLPDQYEGLFERLGPYYLTKKESFKGLINRDGAVVIDFKYQNIVGLNDSLFWVQTDSSWSLITDHQKNILNGISTYIRITKNVFRYLKNNKYGLIYGDQSIHYPAEYDAIRPISHHDHPLFQFEIFIAPAPFHITITKDFSGHLIHSQAYRPHEYEQMVCDY